MKKTLFAVLICGFMVLTLTGCDDKIETNDNVNFILMIMVHLYMIIIVITM